MPDFPIDVLALEERVGGNQSSPFSIGFSGGTIGIGSPGDGFINLSAAQMEISTLNVGNSSSIGYYFIDSTTNLWSVSAQMEIIPVGNGSFTNKGWA